MHTLCGCCHSCAVVELYGEVLHHNEFGSLEERHTPINLTTPFATTMCQLQSAALLYGILDGCEYGYMAHEEDVCYLAVLPHGFSTLLLKHSVISQRL